jgi:pyruvate dehydrogenase E2 component (dihydrolipoamide acetyltransferase)
MPRDVIMPALGMAQETGKVLRWLKTEGATVVQGEPLLEIETDKVTVELEAPADGTLAGVCAAEGDDVPVGQTIAVVLAAGEELAAVATAASPATTPAEPAVETAAAAADPAAPVARSRRRLASPKARRIAAARGVDLESLAGSGPGGAVLAADVETLAIPGQPLSSAWRLMAERTTRSWQSVPHFYLRREVDASRLQTWRAAARAKPGAESVSHTDLLVKLTAEALRRHPRVNATWAGDRVEQSPRINVGIAVATDDGLVVPVVHDADRLGLPELAWRRSELAAAARAGRLRPADVSGGTFTVSNLGMFGVDSFDAIVNAPQAAILAVGRIADRVVAVNGAPAVRLVLQLSISFDHRVVDGARGAGFLDTLASLIEEPAGLVP